MTLAEQLSEDGRRLFAARSFVPVLLLPVVVLALPASWHAEVALGATGSLVCQWVAIAVAFAGIVIRVMAVAFAPDGTSSRDTHRLRATALNTTGIYSVVRHPLYLGSGLMWIGTAMSLRVWWLALIVGLAYLLYLERLMLLEEAFLHETFGPRFAQWARVTPALVPRVSGWIAATGPIQWRRVLSEHNGLLAVALALPFLQYAEDLQYGGEPWSEWYAEHSDLVLLFVIAIAISVASIVARRVPPRQMPSVISNAHARQ